jgi:hypothetical protein
MVLRPLEHQCYAHKDQMVSYKQLEIARGFLVHLSMTFEVLTPYLKGFHLTLASHLPNRDEEGWKLAHKDWMAVLNNKFQDGEISEDEYRAYTQSGATDFRNPPKMIRALPHLLQDLYALQSFFALPHPPEINVRRQDIKIILYGFGDASGSGFGRSVLEPNGLACTIGVWGSDGQDASSNFREFDNIVSTVEEQAQRGNLSGGQFFLFTDNSTVESALHKGNTPSKRLFSLIVKLRKIQLCHDCEILVSHVSGKRMIAQGTDGISRGSLKEGVSLGQSMLSFIPLHLSATERSPSLQEWMLKWMAVEAVFLTPSEWFNRGHGLVDGKKDHQGFWRYNYTPGTFVWAPPPAAADVALEEMRKAVLKRQDSSHVFVCPRLLTCQWRKQLYKAADIVVHLPAGQDGWPSLMYEPLTIGFIFPFIDFDPWQLQSTPKLRSLGRTLPRLLEDESVASGPVLHKFFTRFRTIRCLSPNMVRKLLYFES